MKTSCREDDVTCTLVVTGAERHLDLHQTCRPRANHKFFYVFCPPTNVIALHSVELVKFGSHSTAGRAKCDRAESICELSIEHEEDITAYKGSPLRIIELQDETDCLQNRSGNAIRINYNCKGRLN